MQMHDLHYQQAIPVCFFFVILNASEKKTQGKYFQAEKCLYDHIIVNCNFKVLLLNKFSHWCYFWTHLKSGIQDCLSCGPSEHQSFKLAHNFQKLEHPCLKATSIPESNNWANRPMCLWQRTKTQQHYITQSSQLHNCHNPVHHRKSSTVILKTRGKLPYLWEWCQCLSEQRRFLKVNCLNYHYLHKTIWCGT